MISPAGEVVNGLRRAFLSLSLMEKVAQPFYLIRLR